MNDSEDSGFEEDCDNKLNIDPVKSRKSSSSTITVPESTKKEVIPFIPLVQSGISLEPDMLFGWQPKSLKHSGPIPLKFSLENIPAKSCIFHGFRPEDSLELHEAFSSPYTYSYTINPTVRRAYKIIQKKKNKKDPRPFIGMKPDLIEETLTFNSKFEAGNLDKVSKVKEDEYDLYIRNDSNTYGRNQWYFFEVLNAGEEREIKFNIVNFSKQDSLYNQGLQPVVFRDNFPDKGWHYICKNLKYSFSKVNKTMVNRRAYYCLSFSFTFPAYENLKFAYSQPYSYSDLIRYIKDIQRFNFVKRENLCKSLSGVEVPVLTITDDNSLEKKKSIIVTARVHPGETHGSWLMQGFLEFITSKNLTASRLRQHCVFKVIPMLNPDGVIVGNSRCSMNGQDLNRVFQDPDIRLHPEIYHLKNYIYSDSNILLYLDFHSHSKKKGVFIYGPYFPLHSEYHCKIRAIPKLLSENTEMFRYYSCKFRNELSKQKAARLVVSREHDLPYSYTVEASSFGYLNSERQTITFDSKNLQEVGQHILTTIMQYIDLRNDEIQLRELRAEQRQRRSNRNSPIKDLDNKRTMEDLLNQIKNDIANEDESDSGGSDSDCEKEQEVELMNHKILNILQQVNRIIENPIMIKQYSHSQAPPRVMKFNKKIEVQAKSTLAKYFSRASTDNKNKFKFRAESVKRTIDAEKKSSQRPMTKPAQIVSKFSYSRGLHVIKSRAVGLTLEKTEKNRRPPRFDLDQIMRITESYFDS